MKRIYLVRHGESEWNIIKKIQGHKDTQLTPKGLNQAKLLGKRLKEDNIKIDRIYSSDLTRAYKTAQIIAENLNLDVTPMKEFREISFGIWEGMTNDEIIKNYKKEQILWRNEPEKLHVKGAETLEELQKRAMKGINKIIHQDVKNILVVSHSATLKTIILGMLGIDLNFFKNLTISNVSLSIIELRDYNNVLKLFNDTNHLKEN